MAGTDTLPPPLPGDAVAVPPDGDALKLFIGVPLKAVDKEIVGEADWVPVALTDSVTCGVPDAPSPPIVWVPG